MNEGKEIICDNKNIGEEAPRHTIVTTYGTIISGIITHRDDQNTIIKVEGGYYNLPNHAVREIR